MARYLEPGLPPPFPSTLIRGMYHPKGSLLGLKVGENKKEARRAEAPEGWKFLDGVPIVKLKPKSLFNSANHVVYVKYARKVDDSGRF